MIRIHFHIHYRTKSNERLFIKYQKGHDEQEEFQLRSFDNAHWIGTLEISDDAIFYYQYGMRDQAGLKMEAGPERKLLKIGKQKTYFLNDFWKSKSNENQIFLSSAFKDILLKRPANANTKKDENNANSSNQIQFNLFAGDIDPQHMIGVVGDGPLLGHWKEPILLSDQNFPLWSGNVKCPDSQGIINYKYVLCSNTTKVIIDWENGPDRSLSFEFPKSSESVFAISDEGFRHNNPWWRGAGVAIPIFSLRSKRGLGIGEFTDIKPLADLSKNAGLKVIQVLPVNDTIATKTWKDSYPYAAISIYALHPMYINIESIAPFKLKKDATSYSKNRRKLNALEHIDFEAVLKHKTRYLRILYDQEKGNTFRTKAFNEFLKKNKEWLLPYATFAYLRDINATPDYNQWKAHQKFDSSIISKLTAKKSDSFDPIYFYVFQQFHADKQLKEAKQYASEKGIVLKGDLPIGIYRYSCDAWVAPELFHMDEQAGAPPDDYSVLGQNWGFPTYNWEEMAKDGFLWWQQRMKKLSEYFDALRIDHILGFFRIWQVSLDHVQGTMGMFNPRLPFHLHDLYRFGLSGDFHRFTQPFIKDYFLHEIFEDADLALIKSEYLTEEEIGTYTLKANVDTQAKVKAHFNHPDNAGLQHLIEPLYRLVSEVLLIEEPGSNGTAFNPRITLQKTFSFQALDDWEKGIFNNIYNDYYFSRHETFWKQQAVWKLPALLDATNMLVCGEDLGMIPASVPGVMADLNIIPLEIQRMPKGDSQYGIPSGYPYLSVCSPSCHDMSTIRGWWEGDAENAQKYYQDFLNIQGQAPQKCTSGLVELINRAHLHAPSILAIFPIQDLLGMQNDLKKQDPFAEQINEPSNPDHYWRYRLHLDLEDLVNENAFLNKIKQMVISSGRSI